MDKKKPSRRRVACVICGQYVDRSSLLMAQHLANHHGIPYWAESTCICGKTFKPRNDERVMYVPTSKHSISSPRKKLGGHLLYMNAEERRVHLAMAAAGAEIEWAVI